LPALRRKEESVKRLSYYLIATIFILLTIGCCKTRVCTIPDDSTPREKKRFNPYKFTYKTHTGVPISKSIRKVVEKAGVRPMNILLLSGGGQNGAYGAGFLNGLADRPKSPDLRFDIVTGISTGALQATHVFLGKNNFIDLKKEYTNVTQKDIYRHRSIFELLYASSLYDTAPLHSRIEDFISKEHIRKVADAYEKEGRNLFIGTVDLDTGLFIPWDMGIIAKEAGEGSEEAYRLYWDVIKASAAPPPFFPPVLLRRETSKGEIYENLHADGAVKKNVFYTMTTRTFIDAVKTAIKESKMGNRIAGLDQAIMTVIMNGKVGLRYNDCVGECLKDVGSRSLRALLDEANVSAVFRVYALACANKISFRMTRIPDDVEIDDSPLEFNRETMIKLYNLGYKKGSETPIPWEPIPPTGEDLDGLCP
jgi:hypothetical protein